MKDRELGFSLLEVLIAFAILSLALGSIYAILSQSGTRAGFIRSQEQALLLAQSRLVLANMSAGQGPTSGVADGFRWQVETTSVAGRDEDALRILDVSVRVIWADNGRDRKIELRSLRLAPR